MQLSGLTGGIYRFSEWIMKFAYLNLLWICFSILGLLVFGLMPASSAMFSIVRKWLMGDTDIPIFKNFWGNYRKDFIKINIIGIIFYIIGFIIYIDIFYLKNMNGFSSIAILLAFCVIAFFYLLLLMYIFPTFAHFDLKLAQYFKYAFLFGLTNVVGTIIMFGSLVGTYFLIKIFPAALLFFGISLLAFILMWAANLGFSKVTALQELPEDTNTHTEHQQ